MPNYDDNVMRKLQESWNQMDEAGFEEDPIAAKNADEQTWSSWW